MILGVFAGLAIASPASAFDFDDVATLARRQARRAYEPLDRAQPAELETLTYDQYRDIRFRPDRALWRADNLPFAAMFFHRGRANERVNMNEIVADRARHLPYAIGVDERDQWLKCMSQAMEEEGVDPQLQRALAKAFFGTADWMRNRPEK